MQYVLLATRTLTFFRQQFVRQRIGCQKERMYVVPDFLSFHPYTSNVHVHGTQGYQIGRIFNFWAIVHLRKFSNYRSSSNFWTVM
jgi:hypothetical protein